MHTIKKTTCVCNEKVICEPHATGGLMKSIATEANYKVGEPLTRQTPGRELHYSTACTQRAKATIKAAKMLNTMNNTRLMIRRRSRQLRLRCFMRSSSLIF